MIQLVGNRFALLLEFLSLSYVPVNNGQNGPALDQVAGYGRFSGKLIAVLAKTPDVTLMTNEAVCISKTQSKGFHLAPVIGPISRREQNADVFAHYLGCGVSEGTLSSGIKQQNAPALIGADHRIGNQRQDVYRRKNGETCSTNE